MRPTLDLDASHIDEIDGIGYGVGTVNGVGHVTGIAQAKEALYKAADRVRATCGVRRATSHVAIEDAGRFRPHCAR